MFYSQFILAKKGPLGTIWIAAHLERKLRKNQVADTDIGVSEPIEHILPDKTASLSGQIFHPVQLTRQHVEFNADSIIFPDVPIALRLSSHLMLGVVRIYSRKVNYLFHDCSEALLKIKQAFRSTAVDLPPEESTAPYHSITLPETFHLDDFELPEAAFQGDTDHHVSTKEQITLQDNPEKTGYSTSQFGLDERFGDGGSSHIGLDLEEELMLNKDHSIHLESDDGIIIQGRPSVPSTDMDIDDNQSKDETAERYNNMNDGPSSHGKSPLNADDLGGNSIRNWTGYNVQTPDLNDMLLHSEGITGPSASYYQPSPFPCDEPASPEFVSAQAPSTPGLIGETVPLRVHESPVLSPQRKASPSSNDETVKADTPAAPGSDSLHSATANASDVVGAEATELGFAKPVQVESSAVVQVALVQQGTSEDLPSHGQTSNLEAAGDKLIGPGDIAASGETVTVNATIEGIPLAVNGSELCLDGSTEPSVMENPAQIDGPLVDAQDFQHEVQAVQQEVASNDRPNELISEFAEPEKMLSAPDAEFNDANDLGQITAEKGTTESDGSNKIGSLTSRKRHLEDSLPALESEATERLSSRPHGKRIADFVPDDDDLLASILVGRRTPGLTLGSTPLPPRASSLKRPRLGLKAGTLKRKVQIDDAMVLHADTIRQQLINTEDIRRIRKKAPCTRSEIWMIEKGSLEDDIFHEPIFSCLSEELNNLHNRIYETIAHPTVQNMELQGQLDMSETVAEDSNIVGTSGADTTGDPLHIPYIIHSDVVLPNANDADVATATFGLQIPPDNQVNGVSNDFVADTVFQGVAEPLIDNEREVAVADREHAQVDTLDNDHLQDVPSDLQRSTDAKGSLPHVVLDSSSGQTYAQAADDMTQEELNPFVHSDANVFVNNEVPTSEITGVEYNQEASGFLQPTEDENAVSAMGDNSGFQENNMDSLMDLDMVNDFGLKDCNDFGSAIHGVDTDFLNYDDDGDFDDANNDEPNPDEFQSLDNSGWSSRTRGVARYLKTLFDEESGLGRKSVAIDHLVRGKTRKEASRMFFETLVLTTKDYISVDQPNSFDFVNIKPGPKLLKSEF